MKLATNVEPRSLHQRSGIGYCQNVLTGGLASRWSFRVRWLFDDVTPAVASFLSLVTVTVFCEEINPNRSQNLQLPQYFSIFSIINIPRCGICVIFTPLTVLQRYIGISIRDLVKVNCRVASFLCVNRGWNFVRCRLQNSDDFFLSGIYFHDDSKRKIILTIPFF